MRPRAQLGGQDDLFRSRLDQMINMRHELPRLAGLIDWPLLETKLGDMYTDAPGQPPPKRSLAAPRRRPA
jgi:transposase, IS5 family